MGEPVYYLPLPDPAAKLTELRIHGVSGPDPANILETAAVFHVAGDSITGFARRLAGDRCGPTDIEPASSRQLEGFSWRGVSSGARSRAIWLLLAPFAFVNFAAWMHPMVGEPQHVGSRAETHGTQRACRSFTLCYVRSQSVSPRSSR